MSFVAPQRHQSSGKRSIRSNTSCSDTTKYYLRLFSHCPIIIIIIILWVFYCFFTILRPALLSAQIFRLYLLVAGCTASPAPPERIALKLPKAPTPHPPRNMNETIPSFVQLNSQVHIRRKKPITGMMIVWPRTMRMNKPRTPATDALNRLLKCQADIIEPSLKREKQRVVKKGRRGKHSKSYKLDMISLHETCHSFPTIEWPTELNKDTVDIPLAPPTSKRITVGRSTR